MTRTAPINEGPSVSLRIKPYKLALIALILALSFLAESSGFLSVWNERIGDARMSLSQRPSNGHVVFVAIDTKSLSEIGTWPWSRGIHASLLDRLTAAGAVDVMFDLDFAFPGDVDGDLAFAAALERAGGATYLAVFEQSAAASNPSDRHFNLPLPAFAQDSWPALVNVLSDARGFVRRYPVGAMINRDYVMSAGTLLANEFEQSFASFEIDYSIRPDTIPVLSAVDVLRGTAPVDLLAGRAVIVGASAIELSDQLAVPVHGIVAGPLVHALAAETLAQGRALRWVRFEWCLLGLAFALLMLAMGQGTRPAICIGTTITMLVIAEVFSLLLFRSESIMVPTAMLYPGLFCFLTVALARTLQTSNWQLLRTSAEARNTLRLLERVFDDGMDAVVILRSDGTLLRHSASAAEVFGTDANGALRFPERLRRVEPFPQNAPLQTIELQGTDGPKVLEFRATQSIVERVTGLAKAPLRERVVTLVLRDITKLRDQERDIAYLSNYDDRTGALRRRAFLAFLGLRLDGGSDVIVFALALDRLKTVNVTLGRAVGDAILKEFVNRLEHSPLLLSAPARLGGTSFAVYTESEVDLSRAGHMANQLLEDVVRAYRLENANAQLGVRIGYTTVQNQSGTTAEAALDQAVEGLDSAKSCGAVIAQYDRSAWEKQNRARKIERAMEEALKTGEFHLLYQPQHRVADGALVGAEALIRWESATLGPIYPDEFIGIAESTGFIVELGNWTIEQAARDALSLPPDIVIAVNVSGIQIMRGNLVEDTTRILKQVGIPRKRICFELTETVMLASSDYIIETMQDLNFLGITWALDDFGTGFSSMEYLSKMPLDKVKLDKSFIMGLGIEPSARPILHSTSELCRGLGVKLLCEGVETEEQLAALALVKCEEAQGYLFGKPLPIDQLARIARTRGSA